MTIRREPGRRRQRASTRTLTIGLVAAIATAGCGAIPGAGGDDGGTITAGLGRLPAALLDDEANRDSNALLGSVEVVDLAAVSDAQGLDRPDPDNIDETTAWLVDLIVPPQDAIDEVRVPMVTLPAAPTVKDPLAIEEWRDEFGFPLGEVTDTASFTDGPNAMTVFGSSIDDPTGSLAPLAGVDDVFTVGEGDDFETALEVRSASRPLGRPWRVAADDGQVAMSPSTPAIEAWRDGPRLDSHVELADVAAALDRHDAIAATLLLFDPDAERLPLPGDRDVAQPDLLPIPPFVALGIGGAVDGDNRIVIAAYRFGSAEVAEKAAEAIEQRWADGTSLVFRYQFADVTDLQSVTTDGSTVTVVAHLTGSSDAPLQWLFQDDLVFRAD